MKYILFCVPVLLLSMCGRKSSADFHGLHWGDPRAQVITTEGKAPDDSSEKNIYVYGKTLCGVPMQLGYVFVGNQLASAIYIPQDAGAMKDKIRKGYLLLTDSLTKAYGPSRDSTMEDGAKFKKMWQSKTSNINIIYLKQENETFVFSVVSKKLEPLIEMNSEGREDDLDTGKVKIEMK